MLGWADSRAYLESVKTHLAPLEGGPLWSRRWWEYTDVDHFAGFLRLLARHRPLGGARILDTGCGVAGFLLALRSAGAAELVGVEPDPVRAQLARLRLGGDPRIRIFGEEAEVQPVGEASHFDVVTGLHVLEHVGNPDEYIAALRGRLRPGGLLILACPNRLWPVEAHGGLPLIHWLPPARRRRLAVALLRSHGPRWLRDRAEATLLYETDFTAASMRRLIQRHGFSIVEVNPSGAWGGPAYLVGVLDLLTRRLPPLHRLLRTVVSDQLIVVARAA